MYELVRHYQAFGENRIATIKQFSSKPMAMDWIHKGIAHSSHAHKCEIPKPIPLKWDRNYWLYEITANDIYHIYKP